MPPWAGFIFREEDLAQFGLSAADLLPTLTLLASVRSCDGSRSCPRVLSGRRRADPYISEDSQPALVGARYYLSSACWKRSLERQYDVFSGKVRLTVSEKLTVLGKGIVKHLT